MKHAVIVAAGAALSIGTAAVAQSVPYEKYTLDNGMTVILHEDHSLPIANVNIWYYVGSKDERERRSGFAHLFEHLMFMGTERVPEGAFDTIMEGGGGANNASTSSDRTNYFSWGPANLLPTLLWLDADRLESLDEAMTQDKLDKQRAVVLNERRQSYENQPYGKAYLKLNEIMYPPGHPYSWPVIGSPEDLKAATVDDVKQFFRTYYVPANASLVVAGDFDPNVIKPLIQKLFGTLPAGPTPYHAAAPPAHLETVQRLTLTDDVQLAKIIIAYHSPAMFRDGDADMDLLASVLSSGKSSRLYKRLVFDEQLAADVTAYQDSNMLGSLFMIEVTARPGVELATIEKAIDEEISRLVTEGVSVEELERNKAAFETRMIDNLQDPRRVADSLNKYQFYFSEPDSFRADLDRYRNATPQSVQRWATDVLTPHARLIIRVLPESEEETTPRDSQPAMAAPATFTPAEPEKFTLSNGIEVRFWRRVELPLVSVELLVRSGATSDGAHAGLATLTADMLDEGAAGKDALAFGDALDALGATFDTDADRASSSASLFVLQRNFPKALQLLADAIERPNLAEADWERVRTLHMEELRQAQDNPMAVASRVATRELFGDKHPYGKHVDGTLASVEGITLPDVKAFHAAAYRPENVMLLVAGDLTTESLKSELEQTFGTWKPKTGAEPIKTVEVPPVPARRFETFVVDRPDAVQTVVLFCMPAPKYSDPHRVELQLLNTIFGGSFTSRLNNNLREQKGYTYGARSRYNLDPDVGYETAGASVQTPVTGPALTEFFKEFERIRDGDISAGEAEKARATVRNQIISSFSELDGILNHAATLAENNLPFSTIGEDMKRLATVSASELNAIARQGLPLDHGVLVLVGDKKTILDQAAAIDLHIDGELDVEGNPVSVSESTN